MRQGAAGYQPYRLADPDLGGSLDPLWYRLSTAHCPLFTALLQQMDGLD